MIRSSVTVSLVPEVKGGPFVYWDGVADAAKKAKALGFDAIEIFPPEARAINPTEVKQILSDNNLALAAVGTGAGMVKHKLHLCLPDATARQKARDFVKSIIDVAGPFGAPAIIGSMQGRSGDGVSPETAMGSLRDALTELAEYAQQYNVPLLFEPLNRYETNMVTSIAAGVTLCQSLGSENLRLLADLFHMNIEEENIAAAVTAGGSHIGHVHFVDSNRRAAGMGHMNYAPIATALTNIGYDGYLSAEAFAFPDSDKAAQQTIDTFQKFFRA